ncbi:MAG: M48 family metallopeptidase [Xanthomonadales bacterium]|nr:M48 family metallopeptidase [Xanthomonadales bacterium]
MSDRLARVPRRLEWSGFGIFETSDNVGVDQLLEARGEAPRASIIDRLERHWGWSLAALVALPLCLWLLFSQGMPILARPLAAALPASVADQIDDALLAYLETSVLEPTSLTNERQQDLLLTLEALLPAGLAVDLNFYGGGHLGPNALALPGGTVIFTDELVGLAENDRELAAVFLHEAGHVARQHGLRNLIQTVGVATVLGWILGDLSTVTDLALVGGPAIVQQLSYSRAFELDADRFAREALAKHGIPVSCLGDLLAKLQASRGGASGSEENAAVPGWLSTHPGVEQRIALSREGPPCQAARSTP